MSLPWCFYPSISIMHIWCSNVYSMNDHVCLKCISGIKSVLPSPEMCPSWTTGVLILPQHLLRETKLSIFCNTQPGKVLLKLTFQLHHRSATRICSQADSEYFGHVGGVFLKLPFVDSGLQVTSGYAGHRAIHQFFGQSSLPRLIASRVTYIYI